MIDSGEDTEVEKYEVTLTSPLLDGPFVVEVRSMSPDLAITRTRVAAMHRYHEFEMMHAHCDVRLIPNEEEEP